VGYYIDAWGQEGGGEDGFVEVLEGVGAFHFEGAHGAGEDDGDMELAVFGETFGGVFGGAIGGAIGGVFGGTLGGTFGGTLGGEGLVEEVAGLAEGVGAVEDDDG